MGFFKNELIAEQEPFDTYRARVEARKLRARENLIWWLSGMFLGIAFGMIIATVVVVWLG